MTTNSERFAGLILAGGAGRRFGGPKALALLPDGRSFLRACFDALHAAGADPIGATLPPGVFPVPGSTEDRRLPAGLIPIPLPEPDLPTLESVRAGLTVLLADEDWTSVVLHPVDHPFVRPETIRALGSTGPVTIPTHEDRGGHPIRLRREVAESLARWPPAGLEDPISLRDALRAYPMTRVPVSDPAVLANCNTPEQLAAWLSRAHGDIAES